MVPTMVSAVWINSCTTVFHGVMKVILRSSMSQMTKLPDSAAAANRPLVHMAEPERDEFLSTVSFHRSHIDRSIRADWQ